MNLNLKLFLILVFFWVGWVSTSGIKSQGVRILDVLVYGPILIYTSTLVKPDVLKILLLFMGVTTISYNLKNYFHYKKIDVSKVHPASL